MHCSQPLHLKTNNEKQGWRIYSPFMHCMWALGCILHFKRRTSRTLLEGALWGMIVVAFVVCLFLAFLIWRLCSIHTLSKGIDDLIHFRRSICPHNSSWNLFCVFLFVAFVYLLPELPKVALMMYIFSIYRKCHDTVALGWVKIVQSGGVQMTSSDTT